MPRIYDSLQYYYQYTMQGDFATSKDRAIFYSGLGGKNFTYAMALLARNDGYQVLEETPTGRALVDQELHGGLRNFDGRIIDAPIHDEKTPLNFMEADYIWDVASTLYAKGAAGNVTAFVVGAHFLGRFRRVELPVLLENPKVTHINRVDIDDLRTIARNNGMEACFYAVAEAVSKPEFVAWYLAETQNQDGQPIIASHDPVADEQDAATTFLQTIKSYHDGYMCWR